MLIQIYAHKYKYVLYACLYICVYIFPYIFVFKFIFTIHTYTYTHVWNSIREEKCAKRYMSMKEQDALLERLDKFITEFIGLRSKMYCVKAEHLWTMVII